MVTLFFIMQVIVYILVHKLWMHIIMNDEMCAIRWYLIEALADWYFESISADFESLITLLDTEVICM